MMNDAQRNKFVDYTIYFSVQKKHDFILGF